MHSIVQNPLPFRSVLKLLAVCTILFAASQVRLAAYPAPQSMCSAGLYDCCLDDWQGGGLCTPGYRVASCCAGDTWNCENCGVYWCRPDDRTCFQ